MSSSNSYDYVFTGTGCAGLSLLMRMLRSGHFADKKMLLLDKAPKKENDRTWCFWETTPGFFEEIVYKQWTQLDFFGREFEATLDITPYRYKMIRGSDFYRYCFDEISRHPNVTIQYGEISGVSRQHNTARVVCNGETVLFPGAIVFNSIPLSAGNATLRLLQHFKGWVIETPDTCFNPQRATLMDFRVSQQEGTTFAYLLPFDERRALVEYTLFTKSLLAADAYEAGLRDYIRNQLKIENYRVTEEEFGVIPMSNERYAFVREGVYQIGTAGGQTKASSGYTFQFIQKQSDRILDRLISGRPLDDLPGTAGRFRFYDHTLLYILYHEKLPGDLIFSRLFQKNKPQQVLRFLDNESSLGAEWKVISTLPVWPFFKAAMRLG